MYFDDFGWFTESYPMNILVLSVLYIDEINDEMIASFDLL